MGRKFLRADNSNVSSIIFINIYSSALNTFRYDNVSYELPINIASSHLSLIRLMTGDSLGNVTVSVSYRHDSKRSVAPPFPYS